MQEAFSSALIHWERGIPNSPRGWILQTARRKAIDRIRRQQNLISKMPDLKQLFEMDRADSEAEGAQEIPDERLRLIFTACHPALDQKTQVALTLRTLCGLSTAEISRAFLDSEDALAQRLVRARQKIARAGIAYEVPGEEEWGERLNAVLTVIYLIFNEGYSASSDLTNEAMRLAVLLDALKPDEEEVAGLIALMKLTYSRAPARLSKDGVLIPLEDQDRSLWDQALANEGRAQIEVALRHGRPGPFQLQAAIAAVHSEAMTFAETRWEEIVLIYERLCEISGNPVMALNRAVALSYAAGPEIAMSAIAPLESGLSKYQSFHAAKADFLRRMAEWALAVTSYEEALRLCFRDTDRKFLQERLDRAKKEAEQSSAQVQQGG